MSHEHTAYHGPVDIDAAPTASHRNSPMGAAALVVLAIFTFLLVGVVALTRHLP